MEGLDATFTPYRMGLLVLFLIGEGRGGSGFTQAMD